MNLLINIKKRVVEKHINRIARNLLTLILLIRKTFRITPVKIPEVKIGIINPIFSKLTLNVSLISNNIGPKLEQVIPNIVKYIKIFI